MNKKVIGIIIAVVIILAAIIGVVFLVSTDFFNKKDDNAKPLGSTVNLDEKKENNTIKNDITEEPQETEKDEKTTDSSKILIAYFSRADENYNVGTVEVGNTEVMAGFIKEYFGDKADAFKIEPVKDYPTDYKECTEVATEEKNSNARPEFKYSDKFDIKDYDTIFIGYPIWWGDVPMIINTFLEKYDFSGKKVYLFNTHEGSGDAGTYSSLKSKLSTATVDTNGLAIQGKIARQSSSKETVENWLKELGF